MFYFYYFYQDMLADKKVEELFELKEKIDAISQEEIIPMFKKVLESVCDVFLLCKGMKVGADEKLWDANGEIILSSIDYIVDHHLLIEDSLKIICETKTLFADNYESNLLKIKERILLYTPVFQEISETLRVDYLKLSKPDKAEKTSNCIEWIAHILIGKIYEFLTKQFSNNWRKDENLITNKNDNMDVQKFKQRLQKVKLQLENKEIDEIPLDARPKMLDFDDNKESFIIVSYSRKDFVDVYLFLAHLYNEGYRFWYDNGMKGTEKWRDEYETKFNNPNCLGTIIFFSDHYISDSTKAEMDIIYNKNGYKKKNVMISLISLNSLDSSKILKTAINDDRITIENAAALNSSLTELIATEKEKTIHRYNSEADIPLLAEKIGKDFNIRFAGLKITQINDNINGIYSEGKKEQKYDVYFFRIAEYLMQTGTVSVEKFKERFPLPDQYLKETLEKYEELNLAELNLENNRITVKNNNSNWERKFFEMFEIKKQSSPNLPNEYFTGYNAYLFSYLQDQLFGFDALESKDVFSKKFGKGIISKISYTTKGEPKIEVYFKSGEEKTFYLKNAIDGNCMFIDYIGESDYELIRKYGALIYSENKEELVENFFADEIDFDTSEQIDTSWDISISDYFKEEKYRNIDELRDLLGDFPCGLVSFNIETVEDINDECICILDEQHNFELEETNISESYRAFYSDDEIIESEYVEGKDGEFYEISVLNDWTKDPQ